MRPHEASFRGVSATALNCATWFPNDNFLNLEQIRRTPSSCLAVCFRAWGLLCIVHLKFLKSFPGRIQSMLLLNGLATFRRSDYMAHPIVSQGPCQLQGKLRIPIRIHRDPFGRESRANSRHETPFKTPQRFWPKHGPCSFPEWMVHCGFLLSTSEKGLKSRYAIPRMNVALWDAPKDPWKNLGHVHSQNECCTADCS